MSNLLARLQQASSSQQQRQQGGSSLFNNNAPSIRSQPARIAGGAAPRNNSNNNNASAAEQQTKIMERFLTTIDRFQKERDEMATAHKAELVERDLLSDQVFLRFMIELEEQKKIKSTKSGESLLVDGTEKRRWKKSSKTNNKKSSKYNDDDHDNDDSDSDFDGDSDDSTMSGVSRRSVASTAVTTRSRAGRAVNQKQEIDMQNSRILLSKIEALETKLKDVTKKQQQQQATATRRTTRSQKTLAELQKEEIDRNDSDDDDNMSRYSDENDNDHDDDDRLLYQPKSNSTAVARTATRRVSTARKGASANNTKKESGQRRQRDNINNNNDQSNMMSDIDDTRSVRSVRSVQSRATTARGGIKSFKGKSAAVPAAPPAINVVGPSNRTTAAGIDLALSRSAENPFLHYIRYVAANNSSNQANSKAAVREEGLRRLKKLLNGRANAAGVVPADAAVKAIWHLFGRAKSTLPDLNPSVLVLNGGNGDGSSSNSNEDENKFHYTNSIFSQLVDVCDKAGVFATVNDACQEMANMILSAKAEADYTQLYFLLNAGAFLSFGLSTKINPSEASKMVRSILYNSLLAVFLGFVKNHTSKDTDALKAREWIAFASSLLCCRDLGKNLNIFGIDVSDEKRDLVGLTIELGAQYLYSIAKPGDDQQEDTTTRNDNNNNNSSPLPFSLEGHWDALRAQLDWPRRYPHIMSMCQSFFDFGIQTCEKLSANTNNNASTSDAPRTNQTVFTIIHALRLLFHIISMQTGVGECVSALFPVSSTMMSSGGGFSDDDDDDNNNNSVNNNSQDAAKPTSSTQQPLDDLSPYTTARACLAAFIISDFQFDITQDDDSSHIVSSPTNQMIRALRVVTSIQRPRTDTLLEFAQLLSVSSVLGSKNNSNSAGHQSNNMNKSEDFRLLVNECVSHARERQGAVQGQPAAKSFISSELRSIVLNALGEHLQ